jgi:hypothetical protein
MNYDSTIVWLSQRLRNQARISILLGILAIPACIAILAVAWAMIYTVSIYSAAWLLGISHWAFTIIPWAIIPFLFIGNARTSREYLSEYSVTLSSGSEKAKHFNLPIVAAATINPIAPDTIRSAAKIVTDCLYVGPRLAVFSLRSFRKAFHLTRADVPSCAAVITLLADAGRRMSFQDIADSVEGMNPAETFQQLHHIDGVLFLQSEPAGLALGTPFKAALTSAKPQV